MSAGRTPSKLRPPPPKGYPQINTNDWSWDQRADQYASRSLDWATSKLTGEQVYVGPGSGREGQVATNLMTGAQWYSPDGPEGRLYDAEVKRRELLMEKANIDRDINMRKRVPTRGVNVYKKSSAMDNDSLLDLADAILAENTTAAAKQDAADLPEYADKVEELRQLVASLHINSPRSSVKKPDSSGTTSFTEELNKVPLKLSFDNLDGDLFSEDPPVDPGLNSKKRNQAGSNNMSVSLAEMDRVGQGQSANQGIPDWIRNRAQLARHIRATKGGPIAKEDYYKLLAQNPHLRAGGRKRKRGRYSRGRKRGGYSGAKRFRGGGGGGGDRSRPIVMQPNIVGYGGYDITGYANLDLGDTFRAGIQGM